MQIVKGPYLQMPTRESMVVMWETSEPATSEVSFCGTERVHYGLEGRSRSIPESELGVSSGELCTIHRVRLEGLQAGTEYHYRVRSTGAGGSVTSEEHALRTSPPEETPYSFAVTSETGGFGDVEIDRRVFSQIRRFRPDFLLMVGDAVRNGTKYEDWERYFFGPARELIAEVPFYLCLGNHEERAAWAQRFTAFPRFYAFHYGNAHFVALDSTALVEYQGGQPVVVDRIGPGCAQYEFLLRELEGSPATWKVVFFHYPPYVSGDYEVEAMRELCPALERCGVDLVFNSHTIVYERSHPLRAGRLDEQRGIVYLVAGGAGAMPGWFHPHRAWHTAQALAVPHFVQVVVAGSTLELNAFDDQGRLFDRATLRKAAAGRG